MVVRTRQWVEETLNRIDAELSSSDDLNGWQMRFLADIRERLLRYGVNVQLSEKQEQRLWQALPRSDQKK